MPTVMVVHKGRRSTSSSKALKTASKASQEKRNTSTAVRRLSFAYEELYEVPVLEALRVSELVDYLDLSHNNIRNVRSLANFDRLHTLILDRNLLDSTSLFPPLPSMRILWLNNNEIYDIANFIPALARSCPNIRHLSLMGNPGVPRRLAENEFASEEASVEYRNYRLFVIGHFPYLQYLDDSAISNWERSKAESVQEGVGLFSILPVVRTFRFRRQSLKSVTPSSSRETLKGVNGWMGD